MSRSLTFSAATLAITWVAFLNVATAETSLEVRASPKKIGLSEQVKLNVQIAIAGQSTGNNSLEAPQLDNWDVVGQFKRTSYDSMRGQTTTVIDLQLRPTKTGSLPIGAFSLNVGGKTYRSKPILIEVGDPGAQGKRPPPAGQTPNSTPAPAPDVVPEETETAPDEYAFLFWEVDRDKVWLGEAITAQLYIYYRNGLRVHRFNHGKIDLAGFWNEEGKGDSGRAERVEIGNMMFVRDEIARYTLYPMKAGKLNLPKVKTEMDIARSSFFNRSRPTRIERIVPPLPILVRPLPSQGRPKNYRGLVVGKTRLTARIDRNRIRASEGVELKVELRIEGLIQDVPELELPETKDFQVFPSSTKTQQIRRNQRLINVRRQVWLLRPLKAGRLKIPSLSLAYFDPVSGRYKTARTRAKRVKVTGKPKKRRAVGQVADKTDGALKLHSIRDTIDLSIVSQGQHYPDWFWASLFGAPCAFMLLLLVNGVRRHRDATADTRAARSAGARANGILARINTSGELAPAYGEVHATVLGYLNIRFMQSFKGKTYEQIVGTLTRLGVETQVARALTDELEAIDFARFARAGDADDLKGTIERTQAVISQIEEAVQ